MSTPIQPYYDNAKRILRMLRRKEITPIQAENRLIAISLGMLEDDDMDIACRDYFREAFDEYLDSPPDRQHDLEYLFSETSSGSVLEWFTKDEEADQNEVVESLQDSFNKRMEYLIKEEPFSYEGAAELIFRDLLKNAVIRPPKKRPRKFNQIRVTAVFDTEAMEDIE